MNEITSFTQEIFDKIGYYVYKLIDPRNGEVFYIGKGTKNRVFDHVNGALKKENNLDIENQEDEIDLKTQRITQIKNSGFSVIHVIHRHGLDEKTAFEIEAAMIDDYQGLHILQGGHGCTQFGPMHVREVIELYQAEEADFEDRKVVMITINRTYDISDIYFATRFAWKMNLKRAQQADLVCAVVKGVIKEVFIPQRWDYATLENFNDIPQAEPNRVAFQGILANQEIRKNFIGKKVSKYQVRGAAYPVKYNYSNK